MSEQPEMLTPEQSAQVRARQKGRAKILGLILGALAILFYAITIVKIGAGS
ncbi:hypothetical protein [Sphingorhabdus sp.]|jgi:hypothetical protein|uniref:hypothetical protein n=1 Tax=Sphingorhabdus sp. TaxID=1902408 RepID=UPI001B5A240D|nr:hypothetical protein [Sphingomonadales bacterium]MBK9431385.1 hypothetical protein [Sphingomonadales bacterium]MBL0022711.1 hypothetical protein [Sphingomonadales bacterium]MBP6434609.1 hypothetical protein [Sphingorhabdus sp.]